MRNLKKVRGLCVAAVLTTVFSGCVNSPIYFDDETSALEPGTEGWWAEKAQLPVGERRRVWKGKVWPSRPRPDLPKQPAIHMYHANQAWPYPYVCEDREYVRSLMDLQISNGWTQQTTLYSYHFNEDTHELSVPGQRHLNWILNIAPAQFRNVYLQESLDQNVNQMRLASVQSYLGQFSMGEAAPPVQWRRDMAPNRPAAEVRQMQDLNMQTMPVPNIGGAAGGGGGGGGGAAGGGGGAASGGGSGT
ncbi:MAG: hypothetical protein AB8G99_09865 [Planctomycetaceae bacterium]